MRTALVVVALVAVLGAGVPAGASTSDGQKVKKIVVVKADVPKGWTAQSVSSSPDDDSALLAVSACEGRSEAGRVVTARKDGQFLQTRDLQISSFAEYLKSTGMAKADFAVFEDPRYPACYATETRKQAESPSGASSIQSLTVKPTKIARLGQQRTAIIIELSQVAGAQTQSATIVQALARKGRAIVSVFFTRDGTQQFDKALRDQIVHKLDKRLRKA